MTTTIKTLRKRDGRDVAFDPKKIANAINKAFTATGFADMEKTSEALTQMVINVIEAEGVATPEVEHIQDIVHPLPQRAQQGPRDEHPAHEDL